MLRESALKNRFGQNYTDAFGFGKMVTVSMPIYYEESGIRKILGAAGIDVFWEKVEFGMLK